MIGYTTLGTNDLEKAVAFYDDLFATLGAKRFMETERFVAWAVSRQPRPRTKQGVLALWVVMLQRVP